VSPAACRPVPVLSAHVLRPVQAQTLPITACKIVTLLCPFIDLPDLLDTVKFSSSDRSRSVLPAFTIAISFAPGLKRAYRDIVSACSSAPFPIVHCLLAVSCHYLPSTRRLIAFSFPV